LIQGAHSGLAQVSQGKCKERELESNKEPSKRIYYICRYDYEYELFSDQLSCKKVKDCRRKTLTCAPLSHIDGRVEARMERHTPSGSIPFFVTKVFILYSA